MEDSDSSGNIVDQNMYRSMIGSVGMKMCRHTSKPEGSARWSWRSAWLQRRDNRSCIFLPRCVSQFDPVIDKKRKFISNLRWNVPVCAQTVPSVPLWEQPDVKSHWIADTHRNQLLRTVNLVGSNLFYVDRYSTRRCK